MVDEIVDAAKRFPANMLNMAGYRRRRFMICGAVLV